MIVYVCDENLSYNEYTSFWYLRIYVCDEKLSFGWKFTTIRSVLWWYGVYSLSRSTFLSDYIRPIWYFPGWVGQIKVKDQLGPAEAEIGAELSNHITKFPWYSQIIDLMNDLET